MITEEQLVGIMSDYTCRGTLGGPLKIFWKEDASRHIIYRSGAEDNPFWYSALVLEVADNGQRLLGLEVIMTDERGDGAGRDCGSVKIIEGGYICRVPESVLSGQETPDRARAILTQATPDNPDQVQDVLEQLDTIVRNYRPQERPDYTAIHGGFSRLGPFISGKRSLIVSR